MQADPRRRHPVEDAVQVRAVAAVEQHVGRATVEDRERVVAGPRGDTQHFDAVVGDRPRAEADAVGADRERVGGGGAGQGEPVERAAGVGDRHGPRGPRPDLELVGAGPAVEPGVARPVQNLEPVDAVAAGQRHVPHVGQRHPAAAAGRDGRAVERPVGVGAGVEAVDAGPAVVAELAGDLAELAPAGRREVADRGRRQAVGQRGHRVVPRPGAQREVPQPEGGEARGPERDAVGGRAGHQGDGGRVEEVQVGRPDAAEGARHGVRLGPGDQSGLVADDRHVDRGRHVADEGVALAAGVGGPRPAGELRRAEEGVVAAQGHRVAELVPVEAVARGKGVDGRLEDPVAGGEPVGVDGPLIGVGAEVAAVRADDEPAGVEGDRRAELVAGPPGGQGELPRVAPDRPGPGVGVRRADAAEGRGCPDCDEVAAESHGRAVAVARDAERPGGQRLREDPGRAGPDVHARRALAGCGRGGTDDERPLVHRQGGAEPPGQRGGRGERLRGGPRHAVEVVQGDRVGPRRARRGVAAEGGDRRAEPRPGRAGERRRLRPGGAEALEQGHRAGAAGLVRGADDQRVAGQADRRPEPGVVAGVGRLQHGLEVPVAGGGVGRVDEHGPVVVVVGRADDGGVAVDGDRGPGLGEADGRRHHVGRAEGPGRPALAEAVDLVARRGHVRRADDREALADQPAAGAEVQARVGGGPHPAGPGVVLVGPVSLVQRGAGRGVDERGPRPGRGPDQEAVARGVDRLVAAEFDPTLRLDRAARCPGAAGRLGVLRDDAAAGVAGVQLPCAERRQLRAEAAAEAVGVLAAAQRRVAEAADRGGPVRVVRGREVVERRPRPARRADEHLVANDVHRRPPAGAGKAREGVALDDGFGHEARAGDEDPVDPEVAVHGDEGRGAAVAPRGLGAEVRVADVRREHDGVRAGLQVGAVPAVQVDGLVRRGAGCRRAERPGDAVDHHFGVDA